MTELKNAVETMDIMPRKQSGKNKLFLFISGGVLAVALIVCAVVLLLGAGPAEDSAERVIELGTAMKGVSVNGIDISGMTRDEALAATSGIEAELFAKANFTVDVNGNVMHFTAQDFALQTDYEAVIDKAMAHGRAGTFEERLAAANAAKESPVNFPVTVTVDETGLRTALTALKTQLDTEPVDATKTFTPWGYTADTAADGTVTYSAYTPDLPTQINICKAYASRKDYDGFPTFVRLSEDEMPLAIRYQYWNEDHYQKDYTPVDANVARFIYTDSIDGLVVDADTIVEAVKSQVESGTYETIVAPVVVTPAEVTLEQIKSQTQLISSWTSSYREHSGDSSRNYNVAMMACRLNGAEIDPDEIWSVNDTAGARNATTAKTYGWKQAAGLFDGGTTPQYGGGVCQLGSTVYNAAIRSGLDWTEHVHHSIISGYVPLGMDSTLDSPSGSYDGKDLKLKNNTQNTLYMVTYINPTEKNVTVEFYGVPLTDASGQQIILDYSWKNLGKYGTPTTEVREVEDGYKCPDGKIISAGGLESYQFADPKYGTIVQTYKHTLALDGTPIGDPVKYEYHKYPVINGVLYVLKAEEPTEPTSTATASGEPTASSEPSGT